MPAARYVPDGTRKKDLYHIALSEAKHIAFYEIKYIAHTKCVYRKIISERTSLIFHNYIYGAFLRPETFNLPFSTFHFYNRVADPTLCVLRFAFCIQKKNNHRLSDDYFYLFNLRLNCFFFLSCENECCRSCYADCCCESDACITCFL